MRSRTFFALAVLGAAGCAGRATPPESPSASVTTMTAAPDQHFTSGDVTIRYRDYGRGEPVVLIHGFMRNLTDWSGIADALVSSGNRVIALDLRGHGQSDKPAGVEHYGRLMADDVVRLIEHLRLDRAHLVGQSLGALVAANAAVRHPNRVHTLTLIAGPFWPDSATFMRETQRFLTDMEQGRGLVSFITWLLPGMPPGVAEQVNAETMRENDPALLLAIMRSMASLAVGNGGARPAPAFFIAGTGDPLAPLSTALSARWTGSTVTIVPGANHVNIALRPELFAGMRALMARRSSARPATLRRAA